MAAAAAAIETDPSAVAAVLPPSPSCGPASTAADASATAFSPPDNYSIWTTRPIATLPATPEIAFIGPDAAGDNSSLGSDGLQDMEEEEGEDDDDGDDDELTASMIKTSRTLVDNIVSYGEDEIIPFSDTPQISRFGPISRKAGTTFLHTATPSQTQAVISDEPTATAVVRHSKQSSRQVPSLAALYHTNGSRTTLQPVAVGVNGEISYIAVAEPAPPAPPPDPTLQHIQQVSALNQFQHAVAAQQQQHHQQQQQQHQQVQQQQNYQQVQQQQHQQHQPQQQPGCMVDTEQEPLALMAESERMRQELEQLQKKISKLNVNRDVGSAEMGIGGANTNVANAPSRRCIYSHG